MTILRYIWGVLQNIGSWVKGLAKSSWWLLLQPITWFGIGLASLCGWAWDTMLSKLTQGLAWFESVSMPSLSDGNINALPAWAVYFMKDWLAVDVLIDGVLAYLTVWILAKTARLLMVPIRAIIEVL